MDCLDCIDRWIVDRGPSERTGERFLSGTVFNKISTEGDAHIQEWKEKRHLCAWRRLHIGELKLEESVTVQVVCPVSKRQVPISFPMSEAST